MSQIARSNKAKFIHDVKNIINPPPNKKQLFNDSKINVSTSVSEPQESMTRQLRAALQQAITENECLRDRVIELEALLAEAGLRIEELQSHKLTQSQRRFELVNNTRRCRSA